ncbi:MAG: pilus assembly protein [Burkholderiales bacterium]|nr:pilus assembly protein [Burkholderiales bacterium]
MISLTGNSFDRQLRCGAAKQRGALLVSLMILIAVSLLGISAAQIALQDEKASRNERDRHIAFQAAEAALVDAELDIEHSPDAARSRSHIFSRESALGFPDEDKTGCNSGASNIFLGLCRHSFAGAVQVWQKIDFVNDRTPSIQFVTFGKFTGQRLQTGSGPLPAKPPRYIIELLPYAGLGENAGKTSYVYRITAVGFGAHETTQVALQTIYRKESM